MNYLGQSVTRNLHRFGQVCLWSLLLSGSKYPKVIICVVYVFYVQGTRHILQKLQYCGFLKGKNVLLHWIYSLIYFKCFFSPNILFREKQKESNLHITVLCGLIATTDPTIFFLESKYLRYPNNFISTVSIQYGHFLILCYMNLWKLSWENEH